MSVECQISAFSRAGGRERNEDACGYMEQNGMVCCVMADGAGGHQAGDVASRLCVQSVLESFMAQAEVSVSRIHALLDSANQAVLHAQKQNGVVGEMLSTLVVLLFDPGKHIAVWGHVGDSRLYLFRHGTLYLRTRDHSLVQTMIDGGMLLPEQAHAHPDANILMSSVGLEEAFFPSVIESPVELKEGDALLLCSDGVWGTLSDLQIEECLNRSISSNDWLNQLEKQVEGLSHTGTDNYSAIGIWCGTTGDFMRTLPGPL